MMKVPPVVGAKMRNNLNKNGLPRMPSNMRGLPAVSKGGLGGARTKGASAVFPGKANPFSTFVKGVPKFAEGGEVSAPTQDLLDEVQDNSGLSAGGGESQYDALDRANSVLQQMRASQSQGPDWNAAVQHVGQNMQLANKNLVDRTQPLLDILRQPSKIANPYMMMIAGMGGSGKTPDEAEADSIKNMLGLENVQRQRDIDYAHGASALNQLLYGGETQLAGLPLKAAELQNNALLRNLMFGLREQGLYQNDPQRKADIEANRKKVTGLNEAAAAAPVLSTLNERAISHINDIPETTLGVRAANAASDIGIQTDAKTAMDTVQKDVKDQLLGGLKQFGSRIAQRYLTFLGDAYIQPGTSRKANYEAGFKTRIVLDRMQKLNDIANDIRQDPAVKADPSLFDDKLWEAEKKLPDIQEELNTMMEKQGLGKKGSKSVSKPTVSTQEEFDALPSGAVYIDSEDGKSYKKP